MELLKKYTNQDGTVTVYMKKTIAVRKSVFNVAIITISHKGKKQWLVVEDKLRPNGYPKKKTEKRFHEICKAIQENKVTIISK